MAKYGYLVGNGVTHERKNPIKYMVVDSTDPRNKYIPTTTFAAAETMADKLNKRAGYDRYFPLGMGVENPAKGCYSKTMTNPSTKLVKEFARYHITELEGPCFMITYHLIKKGKVWGQMQSVRKGVDAATTESNYMQGFIGYSTMNRALQAIDANEDRLRAKAK